MNWTSNRFDTRNKNKLEKTKMNVYMNKMAEWKKEVESKGGSIYDLGDKDQIKCSNDFKRLKTIIVSSLKLQMNESQHRNSKNKCHKASTIKSILNSKLQLNNTTKNINPKIPEKKPDLLDFKRSCLQNVIKPKTPDKKPDSLDFKSSCHQNVVKPKTPDKKPDSLDFKSSCHENVVKPKTPDKKPNSLDFKRSCHENEIKPKLLINDFESAEISINQFISSLGSPQTASNLNSTQFLFNNKKLNRRQKEPENGLDIDEPGNFLNYGSNLSQNPTKILKFF